MHDPEQAALDRALRAAAEEEAAQGGSPYDPTSFDSAWVNAIAPPLVVGAAILAKQSFLGFFLTGFHVWIHEFGHATVAWLTGRQATPLPIGWTNVGHDRSNFVYGGILLLLGLLVGAGVKERKIWAVILGLGLAVAQAWMTWVLPEHRAPLWLAFGGVGGECVLAAAMMGFFYFEFPEKFRWGGCRYVFLFIGAGSFFETYQFWKRVKRGAEGIPYGSMVNGEDDAGGDMNILHDDYGWTQHDIIHAYNHLADACLLTLLGLYVVFALRLDRLPGWAWRQLRDADAED